MKLKHFLQFCVLAYCVGGCRTIPCKDCIPRNQLPYTLSRGDLRYRLTDHPSIDEIIARRVSEYSINQTWIKVLRAKFPEDKALMQHLDRVQERSKGYQAQIQFLRQIKDELNKTKGELYQYIKSERTPSGWKNQTGGEEGWLILANGQIKTNYVIATEVTNTE